MRTATDLELLHGVPVFLDQLRRSLCADGAAADSGEIAATAARHGVELLRNGFTIDEVVREYGDVCQAITALCAERAVSVRAEEFQILNRCLDNAIAGAVTEYALGSEIAHTETTVQSLNERLGMLAHELRNLIHTATLAFAAVKTGGVGPVGATGALVDRSLLGLSSLIDRTLANVRVTAHTPAQLRRIGLAELIAEIAVAATLEAQARKCRLTVAAVDPDLAVDADRDQLISVIGNLLQNAFKFTAWHSDVELHAYARDDRVHIEVKDHCGGLPKNFQETMFLPFAQGGPDKSGLGLGLSICRRAVEAHAGVLSVRDYPGVGCIFTVDLPRAVPPSSPPPAAFSN